MLQQTIATGQALVPGSLAFQPAANAVWAATDSGAVITVRLLDGLVSQVGSGYTDPIAAFPLADGCTVAVAEAGGNLYVAALGAADRGQARLLSQFPTGILAAARHPDADRLLVLTAASPDGFPLLQSCTVESGELAPLADAPAGARALVVDDATRTAVVLAVAEDAGTLSWITLDDGATRSVTGLPAYEHLTTSPDPGTAGVLVSDPADPGRLVLVLENGAEAVDDDLSAPVDGLTRWGSLVLATDGSDLLAAEWGLEEGPLPIEGPLGPLYVNGYARLRSDLLSAGVTAGEVAYAVREGGEGGSISLGVEPALPDGTESVMLLAGVRPGEYHLDATWIPDGTLLATRRFRVTTLWPDAEVGPPIAITGDRQSYLMSWGGTGGAGSYFHPAPSSWRVLVVLVYLRDRGWDGLEVGAKDDWKDRVTGPNESVRRFYEEVSAFQPGSHGMTVQLVGDQVFGPVLVDAGWGDVFEVRKPADIHAGWRTKPTAYPALAGPVSDFFADLPGGASLMQLADSICIVVRSGSDEPVDMGPTAPKLATKYVWGHANRTDFYRKTATTYTQGEKPVTVMTDYYPPGAPQHNRTYTLCHEVGHNLGLADLYDAKGDYPAEVNARQAGGVDLMGNSQALPHFSMANRIRLGWVKRPWLAKFDFSANPVGGTVVLQAAETIDGGGPAPGRVAGIEVPVMDDWSYLFEYRREQDGQLGDQRLDTSVVTGRREILVGTDLRVRGGEVARPPILLLGKDTDNDGPLLVNDGQNYEDSDVTNPMRMHDFTLTAQDIAGPDPDSATVEVTYRAAHRPQLQVRPAPGRGDFKSPDIELVGPFGQAVAGAVKGMPNAIAITVHNRGSLEATDVQIHVRWLPFTVAPGSWNSLPDPSPFTVPALNLTKLVVPWNIPASVKVGDVEAEHFCVRVEIDRYRDPAHPEHEEIVVFDNWAQSNFDAKPVGFGSPSDRVVTATTATNGLSRTATYVFGAHQSTDWYRVYVGHAWLRLPAGHTEAMELAYESLAGDPVFGEEFERNLESISARANQVAVTSSVLPENTECDYPRDLFGAGLSLRAGRRAWIEDAHREGELVVGRVRSSSNGETFDVTFGEFHLAAWPDDDPDRVSHTVGEVSDGLGRVLISSETLRDFSDGRQIWFSVARPGDFEFAQTVTVPALLE